MTSCRLAAMSRLALLGLALASAAPAGRAQPAACDLPSGLAQARCERLRLLEAICGAVPDKARGHCALCFLAVNALPCDAYAGDESLSCREEARAVRACADAPMHGAAGCLEEALRQPVATRAAAR